MVIGGKIRSNAPQLGVYLFAPGKNERITILHLDGREDATPEEFQDFLYSVELNSELTRSKNSAYHAYMNPNPEDTTDRVMTKEEWFNSVDILTKQLEYNDQRHGAVLHDLGNGRVHAHIVYERYNHERGVMAPYKQNYAAHDRARAEIEIALNHKPTPKKNKNRDHHKQTLTAIWQRTNTADQFIREAEANGYKIAKGTDRPFRVVDSDGVGFDLVRKLDGINTKDVKARFGAIDLMPEKEAIRDQQAVKRERQQARQEPTPETQQEQQPDRSEAKQQEVAPQQVEQPIVLSPARQEIKQAETPTDEREETRRKFLEQVKEMRERNRQHVREITLSVLIALRVCFSFKGNAADYRANLKQQFVSSCHEITLTHTRKPQEKMLGFIEAAQYYKPT